VNQKKRAAWWEITNDPPSPRFLRWSRGIIIVGWAIALIVGVPTVVSDAKTILRTYPPGERRQEAMRTLIEESGTLLVAVPGMALAIFGFGIRPRRATSVWMQGRPWFTPLWQTRKRHTDQKRKNGV
jgi:hypothetical protein